MTGDYFQEVSKALSDFHKWNTTPQQKPLYMLIKVEVDKYVCWNQDTAEKYANNHCNRLEYELIDHYYPDEPQFPYIAK